MKHRVLVCGDRNWTNRDLILKTLGDVQQSEGVYVVIEGEAQGADTIGRLAADVLGIPVLKFPANWRVHGKSAGPIRNVQMLKEGQPTLVLAFHNFIENSKGTKHMVTIAQKAGVTTRVISERMDGSKKIESSS